jgi:hypothetical protein
LLKIGREEMTLKRSFLLGKGSIIVFLVITLVLVLAASAFWPSHIGASSSTRYVAPTGNDVGDCNSPATSCQSIQYAVNRANSGDTILVAAGIYTYNPSHDPCPFLPQGGKSVVCIVDKALTIRGGYSLNNWGVPDLVNNLTVIDGQNTYRGGFLLGYSTITTNLVMEGFTIQNCRAEGPNTPDDPSGFGGGMLVSGAYVVLRNVVFKNNKVYGQNTASGAGGAASGAGLAINWSQPGTSSLLEHVVFDSNQSYGGSGPERGGIAFGALFVNGSITISNGLFTNNLAKAGDSAGSGIYNGLSADALGGAIGGGGGIWVLKHITATSNTVIGGNATTYPGGGFGGAIHVERAISFYLADSYIGYNVAKGGNAKNGGFGAGGGVLVNTTPAMIEQVYFIANSAIGGNSTGGGLAGPGGGGGLYLWRTGADLNPSASLTNIVVADNYVALGSSGDPKLGGGGGGIQVQGLQANITHATIARNRLEPPLVSGQGLLVLASPGVGSATANVNYSIIADHTEGGTNAVAVLVQEGNALTFNGGLFAGNRKDTNIDGVPMPPGTINGLSTVLSASTAGFVAPGPPNYDYHILPTSPAVDQATSSTTPLDIDGQERPYGIAADLGADEYVRPRLVVKPNPIVIIVEGNSPTNSSVLINVEYTSSPVSWTASTAAEWLFFDENLSIKNTSGQSEEKLPLWFNPAGLELGVYDALVNITSQEADGVTLQVRMIKVAHVYRNYLPLIFRSHQ